MKPLIRQIKSEFTHRFDGDYILVKSPGRVNLIGGHTDYNDGFVLPVAVDKHILLAMAPNYRNKFRFYAVDKHDYYETENTREFLKSAKGWPNYLLGVVDQLRNAGYDSPGFDCVFGGNVPIGAGMSSSAALEGGVVFGLSSLFSWSINPKEMAQIAQRAENEFVGVQCGIMDQFVSLNGRKDCVMKLDCRSLEAEFYPFRHKDIHIVLCDTQVRRELASSEYNVRRSQCEQGVQILQQYDSSIQSLRDVSLNLLRSHKKDFDAIVYKRCKYILEENIRVVKACEDLTNNDLSSFGQRIYNSHEGLRNQYEVSCKELDILVEEAKTIDGVLGARMMGGGFGGCTINLVKDEYLDIFKKKIASQYKKRIAKDIKIYQTKVSGGTHLIPLKKVKT